DAVSGEMMPSSSGEHTDRFLREALFLARLQHPAIPALYDYFFENGDWYLVMDYIAGHTLAEQMRHHSPMPPLEALGYTMQLCEVVDYLHRQTPPIVFRDLKPANILLKPDGTLVLIDFGIARYVNDEAVNDYVDIGSPGYVAPEQYRSDEPHDTRSDLYSLGVMLYQMLTGQRPQEGDKLTALQHINPSLSYALSGLVKLAIRTDPDLRFQSVYTFYLALERVYKIEERRVYQRYSLSQMDDLRNKKETQVPPTMQQPALKGEDTAPMPSVKLEKTPHTEAILPLPSLEQRRHVREALRRARQGRLAQVQLDIQLASVDESLKRRSLQSHSQTPQLATEEIYQPPMVPTPVVQPEHTTQPAITPRRVIQIGFLLAMVIFLVMASLLVYMRITPRPQRITRLHPTPTPIATEKPEDSSWQVLPSLPIPNADNAAVYIQEQGHASIYMSGGYLGTHASVSDHYNHSLYRYDINSASWEVISKHFPAMVNNAATVDEHARIFFTPGYSPDTHTVVSALYMYQLKNGLLQKISAPAQIGLGFGNSMLADQQGHLYITQGFMQAADPHVLADTGWYRYDIATQQWHPLAPLPVGLGYVILTSDSRGGILLLGGATDAGQHMQTNKIYRYDITFNTWTQEASSIPQLLSSAAACQVWPGQMAFIGGYDAIHNTSLNSTWLLDLDTLHWQKLAPLPASGSLLGTATCDGNGHLFLTRGANDPKKPSQDFWMLTVQPG
ncbi:MAG TPA: protein kinase, partial [Ktedonobacteraceae bacterium]|nr:protein kinase [Ktedonobacteraceae bacterium]